MKPMKKGLHFFITTFLTLTLLLAQGPTFAQNQKALEHKLSADGLLHGGEASKAAAEYEKAVSLDPSLTTAYFNLAIAHYTEKNLKGAVSALERLVAVDPQDVEAQYNLACLNIYDGKLETAMGHLEKAKSCCLSQSEFAPLIENAFIFIQQIKEMDSDSQNVLFLLLRQSLPSIGRN